MGEKTVLATGFYPELWVQADFVGQLLTRFRFSHLSQLTKKNGRKEEKRRLSIINLYHGHAGEELGASILSPDFGVDKSFEITQGQSKGQEAVWVRLWSS